MTGSASAVEVPVVVAGAGGAGMMAALTIAREGHEVMLVEKSIRRKCNTELSGGLIQAAGTRFQRDHGIADSPDRMKADIMAKNKGRADESIVEAVCQEAAGVVRFLSDVVGLDLHLDTAIRFVGHSCFRMHATPGETGAEIVAGLRRCLQETPGVTLVDEAPVRNLIVEDDRVVGAVVGRGDRNESIRAAYVVLACNGFAANREMVRRHIPAMQDALYIGSENNTGEAIVWGADLGAALDHMTAYQGHAHVNPEHGTRLGGGMPSLGAILVNAEGRRFAREDQGYSELADPVLAQPGGVAVEIFDSTARATAMAAGSFRDAAAAGAIYEAEDVGRLAARFGLPAEALQAELDDYNAGVRAGRDRLGRERWLLPLQPPYHAARVTGALVHTQGGLRTDPAGRVMRGSGDPIAGLYAVGGAAAGISGDEAAGYLSGNGLVHALVTGALAGRHVAVSLATPAAS